MNSKRDPLDQLLDEWRVETTETRLAGRVWNEIERRNLHTSEAGFLRRLETVFARPSFCVAFVLSCVLLGLVLAEVRVAKIQSARSTTLAQSYLQLVNPLLEEHRVEP
jgi:hypothetical protein